MPTILDNIDKKLLPNLNDWLKSAKRADFCVGYFNLRGWRGIASPFDAWTGADENRCRLLIGMHVSAAAEIDDIIGDGMSKKSLLGLEELKELRREMAKSLREQLSYGSFSNVDEAGLRQLYRQLKNKQVSVKLYPHRLHAKLYLLHYDHSVKPFHAVVGSSNLTRSGLEKQGELNVTVEENVACAELLQWFNDRWNDPKCFDVSEELIQAIEDSWASEEIIPPYFIYLKMAYHLSELAREGVRTFSLPQEFRGVLLPFQEKAVQIAAYHVNEYGGVMIGDVVGLGKTMVASALAKVFQEDQRSRILIVCPKNLKKMWEEYAEHFKIAARVLSQSEILTQLDGINHSYDLVIIDESHNLRNREGKRFKRLQQYIHENESQCVLLTATPYNKEYRDLSSQLGLFMNETDDLGIRPERAIRQIGGDKAFVARHSCHPTTLKAFDKSEYSEDWRNLMRLFLIRRTRGFVKEHYAKTDPKNGRKYLELGDGTRSYFPDRLPKTQKFEINDQYAQLYSEKVVDIINKLELPRYGLGAYVKEGSHKASKAEEGLLDDLSRAGTRLKGFCRSNLFKRLESSGYAFLLSIERHILRNHVFLYAIENGLDLPIGTQDAGLLDVSRGDDDEELEGAFDDDGDLIDTPALMISEKDYRKRVKKIYEQFAGEQKNRFKWLSQKHFTDELDEYLKADAAQLLEILKQCGDWNPKKDSKLESLEKLLQKQHKGEKVLVFTQFADTALYLERELKKRHIDHLEGVTGGSENATDLAWRFSPKSNQAHLGKKEVSKKDELRVLVATDVLSEGQNLQDCSVIVNFDIPWTLIRLVQRAGRVDRIGQAADHIDCYSFLPAEGVENIIRLRQRVRQRMKENAEVVGTDESFFEDDPENKEIHSLYSEKSKALDADDDMETDLGSQAYMVWKDATENDPKLAKQIERLADGSHSTKVHSTGASAPEGVLVLAKTGAGFPSAAWIGNDGAIFSESPATVLEAAQCKPETKGLPHGEKHYPLVNEAMAAMKEEKQGSGGNLGMPGSVRRKLYDRIGAILSKPDNLSKDDIKALTKIQDDIYGSAELHADAHEMLSRQLRLKISTDKLIERLKELSEADALVIRREGSVTGKLHVLCSMGLVSSGK